MARLMLSAGMFSALAATIAVRNRGFMSGSPPDFAAIAISLMRRVKILPRLASSAPFLCLMVAHFEWPDIAVPRLYTTSSLLKNFMNCHPDPERSRTGRDLQFVGNQ